MSEFKCTLKDLIRFHCSVKNKKILCEFYFNGESDPAFVVDCGVIFGDIIATPIVRFEHPYPYTGNDFRDSTPEMLDRISDYYNNTIFAKFKVSKRISGKYNTENIDDLYNTLVECWDEFKLEHYVNYEFVCELLHYCEKNHSILTYDILEYLLYQMTINAPVATKVIMHSRQESIVENMFFYWIDEDENTYTQIEEYVNLYNTSPPIESLYELDNLPDLLLAMLIEITKNNKQLKRCSHCGKWFIPVKNDEKYCPRINDGISCKQAAAKKVRQETNRKKPYSKMYNNVNTNLANRWNNAKTDEERQTCEQRLLSFRAEAIEWKKQIKQGIKTEMEYEQWLANYLKK